MIQNQAPHSDIENWLRIYNKVLNIEAKLPDAQYSSVTFAEPKIANGKLSFIIKKDYTFNDKILKTLTSGAEPGVKAAITRLKKVKTKEYPNGFEWTNLSELPNEMFYILQNESPTINGVTYHSYFRAMQNDTSFPLDGISEIYNNKKHAVNDIYLTGRGMFYMG